jgi:hypothetical protein
MKKQSKNNRIKHYINICQEFSVECILKAFESLKKEKRKTYEKYQCVYDINDIFVPSSIYIQFVMDINKLLKCAINFNEDLYETINIERYKVYRSKIDEIESFDKYKKEIKNDKGVKLYIEKVSKKYDLALSLYDELIKRLNNIKK